MSFLLSVSSSFSKHTHAHGDSPVPRVVVPALDGAQLVVGQGDAQRDDRSTHGQTQGPTERAQKKFHPYTGAAHP